MNRRTFIGSVIGTLISTQLPFLVEEAIVIEPEVPFIIADWLKHRMYILLDSGIKIWAPVIQCVIEHDRSLKFEAQDIRIHQALTVVGGGLTTLDCKKITESVYAHPLYVINGDVIRLCLTKGV